MNLHIKQPHTPKLSSRAANFISTRVRNPRCGFLVSKLSLRQSSGLCRMACSLTYHNLNTFQQRLRSFMTIRDPGRGKPRPTIPRTLQPSCSNSPNLQPAVAAARQAKNI
ncbi:hypothetical protein EAF00_010563 [Botryotinia globosa]|nr:hypothetical protein EAF00_010563 [Botryotinia globosa]